MTKINKQVTYLQDYVASAFVIDSINLDVDLYEDHAIVIATLAIHHDPSNVAAESSLKLHGEKLTLKAIKLDGKLLAATAYEVKTDCLIIYKVPQIFKLEIITYIEPQNNTELVGLYKTKTMFCTQCEAEGFRRITYYLDRPDIMAKFTTTIRANKQQYPVLLSNGNLIAKAELANGRHLATWEDPFNKPSYLFALVAGSLIAAVDHFVTQSGRLVTIWIYVEQENIAKVYHALQAVKKAMLWDEQNYGREYDLDTYMIVAINDFNMGAMENKGLNIFNAKYILASPQTATDVDYSNIDAVVAHEYLHNWSGNRITCRDWFQLSLKEGFTVFREQQFSQDIAESAVARITQVKTLLQRQFVEDSGALAHPVRPLAYEEINNFYTATVYEKGAEIIRMLWVLLGPQLFRQATDLYFKRYDGKAITIEDFINVIQEISGHDLAQFMLWYQQAGTPQVIVEQQYDAVTKKYSLRLRQYCPPTPQQATKQAMHIPLAIELFDQNGQAMAVTLPAAITTKGNNKVISLQREQEQFDFMDIASKPILSIGRNFSAPIQLTVDYTLAELAILVEHDSDPFNRWDAFRRLKQQIIIELITLAQAKQQLTVNPLLMTTYKTVILAVNMDLALKAELLLLPSSIEMVKYLPNADPDIIYLVKNYLKTTLATKLQEDFYALYLQCVTSEPYSYTAKAVAKRQLKNVCLDYLVYSVEQAMINLGVEQFTNADNMTDVMGVLAAITQVECLERGSLLERFYQRWKHEPLVMDKWLWLQAIAELPNTVTKVSALLQHESFTLHTPNKVYALLGGFANNVFAFHHKTGAGYKLLAEVVLQVDAINPQVAARIVSPFAQWHHYDVARQKLMQQQLLTIINQVGISKNLTELVEKCLREQS